MIIGKIPSKLLKEKILKYLGSSSQEIILGPRIGADAAILRINKAIAFHTDPITGARKRLGKISMYVATNDIITIGAKPKYASICMIFPRDFGIEEIESIQREASEIAKKYGIAIVGGHVEINEIVNAPLIVTTVIGEMIEGFEERMEKIARIKDEYENYCIIQIKPAAIEATAIIALDHSEKIRDAFSEEEINKMKALIDDISVYDVALDLYEKNLIIFAHDPTEGGILVALKEIADFLDIGLFVEEEKILLMDITKKVLNHLKLDPLKSLSSGCLLAIAEKKDAKEIIELMKSKNKEASIIGNLDKNSRIVLRKDGSRIDLDEIEEREEIWKLSFSS